MAARSKNIQFSIRTDSDTKACTLCADKVLARHDQTLLSDRDVLLFEALLTREIEPNDLVRAEVTEFNQGRFDAQSRYHW